MQQRRPRVAIVVGSVAIVGLSSCSSGETSLSGSESQPASAVATTAVGSGEAFAGGPREYHTKVADCLSGLGFPSEVVVTDQGDLGVNSSGVDQNTMNDYLEADRTCTAEIPAPAAPESHAELEQYYETWSSQHLCLTEAGYDLPAAPTLDTFIATYRSGELMSSPISLLDGAQQSEAVQECPPDIENWW